VGEPIGDLERVVLGELAVVEDEEELDTVGQRLDVVGDALGKNQRSPAETSSRKFRPSWSTALIRQLPSRT